MSNIEILYSHLSIIQTILYKIHIDMHITKIREQNIQSCTIDMHAGLTKNKEQNIFETKIKTGIF